MEMDGRSAKEEAAKLARQIGDEEWKAGNTKYAFEAWEASDINSVELFDIVHRLFEAEKLMRERDAVLQKIREESRPHINFVGPLSCNHCEREGAVAKTYNHQIVDVLGWQNPPPYGDLVVRQSPEFFRAAAVAGLKLIKRR